MAAASQPTGASANDSVRSCIPLRDSPGFTPGSLSRCQSLTPLDSPTKPVRLEENQTHLGRYQERRSASREQPTEKLTHLQPAGEAGTGQGGRQPTGGGSGPDIRDNKGARPLDETQVSVANRNGQVSVANRNGDAAGWQQVVHSACPRRPLSAARRTDVAYVNSLRSRCNPRLDPRPAVQVALRPSASKSHRCLQPASGYVR